MSHRQAKSLGFAQPQLKSGWSGKLPNSERLCSYLRVPFKSELKWSNKMVVLPCG